MARVPAGRWTGPPTDADAVAAYADRSGRLRADGPRVRLRLHAGDVRRVGCGSMGGPGRARVALATAATRRLAGRCSGPRSGAGQKSGWIAVVGPCLATSPRRATCRSSTAIATGRTGSASWSTTCARASTSSCGAGPSGGDGRADPARPDLGRDTPPTFAHHPLVRTAGRRKLSKSAGDTGVREMRATGSCRQRRSSNRGLGRDRLRCLAGRRGLIVRSTDPPSPTHGRARARRSAGPRSAAATCGRRAASHRTAGAGPRASRSRSDRRPRVRRVGLREADADLAGVGVIGSR